MITHFYNSHGGPLTASVLPDVFRVESMVNFSYIEQPVFPGLFMQKICKKLSTDQKFPIRGVKSLRRVLNVIASGENDMSIKAALIKPSGYWSRLFSRETWTEWLQPRTSLGRVVQLFIEVVEGSTSIRSAIRQLDPQLIRQADVEARKVFNEQRIQKSSESRTCELNMVIGGALTVSSGNPLPVLASVASCLDVAAADNPSALQRMGKHRTQIFERVGQQREQAHRSVSVIGGSDEEVSEEQIEACHAQLISEVQEFHRDANTVRKLGKAALRMIKDAWKVLRIPKKIYDEIMKPKKALEKSLNEWDEIYWIEIVQPEYVEVFPYPSVIASPGEYYRAQVKLMKEKLRVHGYHAGHGTPVQYLQMLQRSGVCEGGKCKDRDL